MITDFKRQDGETAAEWLARLESVNTADLTTHDCYVFHGKILQARDAAKRETRIQRQQIRKTETLPPEPQRALVSIPNTLALDAVKEAFLLLPMEDRQQLILWALNGCPKTASPTA